MRLIEEIMNSSYDAKINENLFEIRLTGIPIGNLTSQLFANIYLNELDRFIKRNLGVKRYVRYMDDFLILATNKDKLIRLRATLRWFLSECLNLALNPGKANVYSIEMGINFLGYKVFRNYRLILMSAIRRFVERIEFYRKKLVAGAIGTELVARAIKSWFAYAEFGNSWGILQKLATLSVTATGI